MLCVVLCTVAGSAPANGSQEHDRTTRGAPVSAAAPPVGVHSLAYYRGTAVDALAEVREIRAASRNAVRARNALAVAAAQTGVVLEAAQVEGAGNTPATAAGAAAGYTTAKRARPGQQADRPRRTAQRKSPGRQRASTPRVAASRAGTSRAATSWKAATRAAPPRLGTSVGAGNNGFGLAGGGGVVGFALAQVGKGYRFGSVGPERFDCSGLVAAAYRRVGISLPHQTGALAGIGRPVGRGELRPGDLVFPSASHVGIYIGGGRIVHASTERGGVKISPIYAFRFARRIG